MTRVMVLLGSLRATSVNRQLAETAISVAPDGVVVELFERLGELPFYSEDIDNDDVAEPVRTLREEAARADAVLVVTPEYNGGIPAVLKNAIDWLSRPYGNGALKGKPLAVIGASMSSYGGKWAHDQARKSFAIAGTRVMESIELSLSLKTLGETPVRQHAELAEKLLAIVTELAGHTQ